MWEWSKGRKELRELVISGYLPLAKSIASVFARRYPRYADDYESDAFYHLIKVVDGYADGSLEAIIVTSLNRKMLSVGERYHRASRDHRRSEDITNNEPAARENLIVTDYLNGLEAEIIILKMANYTEREIADVLDTSVSVVRGYIIRIRHKMLYLLGVESVSVP